MAQTSTTVPATVTSIYASAVALEAALAGFTDAQRAAVAAAPPPNGGFSLKVPAALASLVGTGPTAARLEAYADSKQTAVLAALVVSHPLKDGSATLDTKCGASSMLFLNALGTWVALNAGVTPAPTRNYRNLDGSIHQVSVADMAEFLAAVGAAVQSTFDVLAAVTAGLAASPPTIKTLADINALAWPTTAG